MPASLLKTHSHRLFVWGFLLLVAGGYALLAWNWPVLMMWATFEDLTGEWTQVFFFAATCLVAGRLAWDAGRYRVFFILLGLACFYVAMEEISWGQRIFGFASPEYFRTQNLQGEINIHNFFTGPFATTLKHGLAYLIAAGLIGYGVVYPWALGRGMTPAAWLDRRGLAAPPGYLWPVFIAAAVFEVEPVGLNEAEVAEILVGFGLLMTAVHYRFASKRQLPPEVGGAWLGREARRLSLHMAAATVLVIGAAALTTYLMYQRPQIRAITADRFEDGYFKYAHFYAAYGRWDQVLALNLRLKQRRQHDMDVNRRIAEAYRALGDEQKFNQYVSLALDLDEHALRSNPERDDTMRSLAKSYRLLGDEQRAAAYLNASEYLVNKWLERAPQDAGAWYAMGETLNLRGEPHKALEYYRRAFEQRPDVDLFKNAYLIQKAQLGE
ncbi:MAG: hypothetical protein AB1810_14920 [Pseudomonadota bacterium]